MGRILFWLGAACIGVMAQDYPITVNFQGMTPHIGQMFKIRLVETPSGVQRAETTLVSLTAPDFQINFTGESGKNYNLDYYADVDGTRSYTAPPKDHAWRRSVVAPHHGGVVVTAAHDVNFTDIKYPDVGSSIGRIDGAKGKAMAKMGQGKGYTLLGRSFRTRHRTVFFLPRAGAPSP